MSTTPQARVECNCGAVGTVGADVLDAVTPHDVHIEAGRARMNYAGHEVRAVAAATCDRCKRELSPWPLARGNKCSPKGWVSCIRNDDAAMLAVMEAVR